MSNKRTSNSLQTTLRPPLPHPRATTLNSFRLSVFPVLVCSQSKSPQATRLQWKCFLSSVNTDGHSPAEPAWSKMVRRSADAGRTLPHVLSDEPHFCQVPRRVRFRQDGLQSWDKGRKAWQRETGAEGIRLPAHNPGLRYAWERSHGHRASSKSITKMPLLLLNHCIVHLTLVRHRMVTARELK